MTASGKRNIAYICVSVILYCLLRNLLYNRSFADLFPQQYCGAVALSWAISVRKRVTDKRLMRQLLGISFCLVFYMLCQCVNYRFSQSSDTVSRYAWYCYYLFMAVSLLLFYDVSLSCYRKPEERPGRFQMLLNVLSIGLALGILTNDLNFLAFRFETPEMISSSPRSFGPLYFVYFAWFTLLSAYAVFTVVRKYRTVRKGNEWLLLLIPITLLLLYVAGDITGMVPRVRGIKLMQIGEAFSFAVISFLEICIDFGMIPANTDYERLFSLSDLHAVIVDSEGRARYSSSGQAYPFPEDPDLLVLKHPISGGSVEWCADISDLNALNSQLTEVTRSIDARNEYLSTEARVKQEKTEVETRNRIYDEITRIVKPQLAIIEALLDDRERSFDERLRTMAVICAYIKRRSNMQILAREPLMPVRELSLAIAESLDFIKLKGVNTASVSTAEGEKPSALMIAAYEQFEAVLEDCMESLTDLMVLIGADGDGISLRMMMRAGDMTLPAEPAVLPPGVARNVSVSKNGQDVILVFGFSEGGAAA